MILQCAFSFSQNFSSSRNCSCACWFVLPSLLSSGLQAARNKRYYPMGELEGSLRKQRLHNQPRNIKKLIIPGTKVHFIFT